MGAVLLEEDKAIDRLSGRRFSQIDVAPGEAGRGVDGYANSTVRRQRKKGLG